MSTLAVFQLYHGVYTTMYVTGNSVCKLVNIDFF